ncbi:MAG: hypothetical protein PHW04_02105 [Candidatus Wallbacteria bacterium]|nr:hypothetical protein [Candidatus Wallbacteria bacterium]
MKQIREQVIYDLRYLLRSRDTISLVIAIFVLMLFIYGTQVRSEISSREGLEKLAVIESYINLLPFMVATFSLMLLVRGQVNQSLRLVFTRPVQPSIWVLSLFLAVAAVTGILFLINFLILVFSSLYLGLDLGIGLPAAEFLRFILDLSKIALLLLATLLIGTYSGFACWFFIGEQTFVQGYLYAGYKASIWTGILKAIAVGFKSIFALLYYAFPDWSYFTAKLKILENEFAFGNGEVQFFFTALAYLACLTLFLYLLSVLVLSKKMEQSELLG